MYLNDILIPIVVGIRYRQVDTAKYDGNILPN